MSMLSTLGSVLDATKDTSPEVWLALGGAIFGGVGLKVVEYFLSKGKTEFDEQTSFRQELREELKSLREEIGRVQKEEDRWRSKYYTVLDAFVEVKNQLDTVVGMLQKAGLSVELTDTPTIKQILEDKE